MGKRKHDEPDLAKLPVLSTRRVCLLADCSPSKVSRSPLVPVGACGKTKMYRTADVMAWIAGTLGSTTAEKLHESSGTYDSSRTSPRDSADALARLANVKAGAK